MGILLGDMVVRFTADIAQLTAGAAAAKDEVAGFGSSASLSSGLATGALLAVGAAAIGVGVVATKMAGDYEQAMNKVKALTGSSTSQMTEFDTGLKKLAVDAGVAPKQLADGLYNVISAGYQGKDAMNVLTLATEDAKIGMTSATVTTDALTNVLRTFGVQSKDITKTNGEMLQTVTLGKATFEQYATTIVKSASAASQFHVSMETMNAAWSTLTSTGIRAGQASTDFSASLRVMDGNIGTVAKSLQKNGIAFNETAFNAMDYGHKVTTLNAALQEAADKHVHITGVTVQAQQAIQAISDHITTYNKNLATLSNNQAMNQKTQEAWAITQNGFNQSMSRLNAAIGVLLISLGNALLPVLTKVMNAVTPLVTSFTNWVTSIHSVDDVVKAFNKNIQVAGPILAGIAAMLLAVLIPAVWSLAAGVIAATWPVLAIGAAVAGLAALFIWLYKTFEPVRAAVAAVGDAFQSAWAILSANFMPVMKIIGDFLVSTWLPVWKQLVETFNTQLKPALDMIINAVKPYLPLLEYLALGVIAVLVIEIMVWMKVMSQLLIIVIKVFGDIVQIVKGTLETMGGLISFFSDLFTGRFNKLGGDLHTIFQGISDTVIGVWKFLADGAFGWAQNMISQFIGGIQSMFGQVGSTMSSLVGFIGSFLPHSPAKQGELSNLNTYGPALVKGITTGIDNSSPILKASMTHLVQPAGGLAAAGAGSASAGAGGGQTIIIELDSKQLSRTVLTQMDKQVRLKVGNRSTRVA